MSKFLVKWDDGEKWNVLSVNSKSKDDSRKEYNDNSTSAIGENLESIWGDDAFQGTVISVGRAKELNIQIDASVEESENSAEKVSKKRSYSDASTSQKHSKVSKSCVNDNVLEKLESLSNTINDVTKKNKDLIKENSDLKDEIEKLKTIQQEKEEEILELKTLLDIKRIAKAVKKMEKRIEHVSAAQILSSLSTSTTSASSPVQIDTPDNLSASTPMPNTDAEMFDLGNGVTVPKHQLSSITQSSGSNAAKFARGLLVSVFSVDELLDKSLTGKVCNSRKQEVTKEMIDPVKKNAIIDYTCKKFSVTPTKIKMSLANKLKEINKRNARLESF